MFQVQKGIPTPAATRSSREGKYPWKQMESGDSFVIPCDVESDEEIKKVKASVYSSAKNAKAKVRLAVEEDGVRVWLREFKTDAPAADAADAPTVDDEGGDE